MRIIPFDYNDEYKRKELIDWYNEVYDGPFDDPLIDAAKEQITIWPEPTIELIDMDNNRKVTYENVHEYTGKPLDMTFRSAIYYTVTPTEDETNMYYALFKEWEEADREMKGVLNSILNVCHINTPKYMERLVHYVDAGNSTNILGILDCIDSIYWNIVYALCSEEKKTRTILRKVYESMYELGRRRSWYIFKNMVEPKMNRETQQGDFYHLENPPLGYTWIYPKGWKDYPEERKETD